MKFLMSIMRSFNDSIGRRGSPGRFSGFCTGSALPKRSKLLHRIDTLTPVIIEIWLMHSFESKSAAAIILVAAAAAPAIRARSAVWNRISLRN